MRSLKNKLIISKGDIGLMQDLEKFEREHPEARIEFATHEIAYGPKIELIPEQMRIHYCIIWYREK